MPTERETPQRSDERDDPTQREQAAVNAVILQATSSSIQDSDRENSSSVGTATRQEELSLTQSTVGKFSNRQTLLYFSERYVWTCCSAKALVPNFFGKLHFLHYSVFSIFSIILV